MENNKNQAFTKTITKIIKNRTSVRTYENKPLSKEHKEKLEHYFLDLKGPFGIDVKLKIVDTSSFSKESGLKLGTYGMIKGASSFITAVVEKQDYNMEELGYILEKVVLLSTSLNLGTCWLGGTFNRGEFAKAIELKENELLPIITPIGYGTETKRFLDSAVKFIAGSKKRKSWQELYYVGDFNKNLTESEAKEYYTALEMVRLAPSASNKQPWRILKEKDTFHFYLARTKGYAASLGYDIQKIDIGIAMCHFEMTLKEQGIEGMWVRKKDFVKPIAENMEYIVSFQKNLEITNNL